MPPSVPELTAQKLRPGIRHLRAAGPAQQSLPPPGGLAQGATTHPLGRFAHRLQRAQNSRLHLFAHPDSSSAQSLALGVACTRQRAFPQSRAVGGEGEGRRLSGDVGPPPPFNHDRLPGGGDGCGAGNGGKELARQMGSGRLFPAYGAAWAEGVWAEQGGRGLRAAETVPGARTCAGVRVGV